MDFRRGGADYSDGAMVNDEVLGRLKEEFGAEMAPHVVSPGSSMHRGVDEAASNSEDGERKSSDGATEESGHHGGADGSGGSTKRVHSHGKFLARKKLELKSKAVSLSSLKKEVEQNIKKVSSTHDETSNILHVIQSRQLDATKTAGERNVDARRRELEAESQRNRGVKEAIQAARANSGGFAQKIAEKVCEILL